MLKILFTQIPENFLPISEKKHLNESEFPGGNPPLEIMKHFVGVEVQVANPKNTFYDKGLNPDEEFIVVNAYHVIQEVEKVSPGIEKWFDENGFAYTQASVGKGFYWYIPISCCELILNDCF